ncbi:class I SAM-dependent methyltransferase [Patescibacteria group bacterium]|nr:class I SAM-dependent methyltransferase [Patescibacteria group bacterium]
MVNNKNLYDKIWKKTKVRKSSDYPEWVLLEEWVNGKDNMLEIGPGTRPRLPIEKGTFIDVSETAMGKLNKIREGCAIVSDLEPLPFVEGSYELICAFDVIEHVENDQTLIEEISRVLSKEGLFVFSVPMHQKYFDRFDKHCGHFRRYEPSEIEEKLKKANLKIVGVSRHGLRPKNRLLNYVGYLSIRLNPKVSAQLSEIFYGYSLKRAKKNTRLESDNLKGYLNDFYAALIVAKKATV